MSAVAERVARSAAIDVPRVGVRMPLWGWVIASRLLVLIAGTWGSLVLPRAQGWHRLDPSGFSTSMGTVGNLLGAAAVRWDAVDYLAIAEHGYTHAKDTRFFPLYPTLIHLITPPGGSPIISGLLISSVAFGIGLVLLHRLTRWHLGRRLADVTVLLIAFGPFSFVFSAVYTASLMFALAVGTFYLARQQRFVLASLVAAAAALVHIEGVLLIAPLALMYWRQMGSPRRPSLLWSPSLPALMLPALSLGGWFVYMQMAGWGWLAPITNQHTAHTGRTLVGTPLAVFDSVKDILLEATDHVRLTSMGVLPPAEQNVLYLCVLGVAMSAVVVLARRRLPLEHCVFSALAILVFSSSAVGWEPLKGFDRYILAAFPLWIGLATWLDERGLTNLVLAASSVLLVCYTIDFTRWIPVF